jgi:hypothetical protein
MPWAAPLCATGNRAGSPGDAPWRSVESRLIPSASAVGLVLRAPERTLRRPAKTSAPMH